MSLYKVYFKWKEKDVELTAKSLDLTHPYFVSIKDLVFPANESLIIDPNEDVVRNAFGESDHVMIPFQTVSLIEEIKDGVKKKKNKVMPFSMVEEEDSSE